MTVQTGKRYFGPFDNARLVMSVDGNTVAWQTVAMLDRGKSTAAEFDEWASHSQRRNYTHENGERRIKLSQTDEAVTWVAVEDQYAPQTSPMAEWAAWRADAT